MQVYELVAALDAGRIPNVVLIAGSERFFIERAIASLRKAVVGEGPVGFNEDVFDGKNLSASRVIDTARTLPMLASYRLCLVREVDALASAELDKLADYMEAPSPSSCVVLVAEKLDGRSKLVKRAQKLDAIVDASPLKQGELRSFLQAEAQRRGARLLPDAAAALLDAIGNDLPAIDDALERLGLYVGNGATRDDIAPALRGGATRDDIAPALRGGATIDTNAVYACIAKVRVESIWALVDAVGMRDRPTAMRAAASLLADREPALRILAMVARQLRIVARMRSALEQGMPAQDATRVAGAPPFKARELATAARRFDPRSLARAFTILAETDLALKGSKRPPDLVLEHAILELTR